MTHYKIKLVKNISKREAWVPIYATDMNQARVEATLKCTKTEFIPDYPSLQVMDEEKYQQLNQIVFKK